MKRGYLNPRIIEGKRFAHMASYDTKGEAKFAHETYKAKGFLARTFHIGSEWAVYARRP